jgi:DNA-binding NarL/FixJ family response regulator
MSETLIIQKDPLITVTGENLYDFPQSRVESVTFGPGELAVNLEAAPGLLVKESQIVFLASLGMSNADIGAMLYLTPSHVKGGILRPILQAWHIQRRSGLARRLFDSGAYVPVTSYPSLILQPREQETINHVTQGYTGKEIGSRIYMAESTTKEYLTNASKRNGIRGRVQLALAALMAGQIEGYPAANLPPPPLSQ